MTDRDGRPVWSAEYAPFGRRLADPARLDRVKLQLRLPGQWEDEESRLHYNDQRYYDPSRGRYISRDPLGLAGGLDAYAYAGNNPLRYSDPRGLVLFAFDGTMNTDDLAWLHANGSSLSNVVRFRDLYLDGNRRYISGVGTIDRSDPTRPIDPGAYTPWYVPLSTSTADGAGNYSGPARIDRMVAYLGQEVDAALDNSVMEIDIIGFSRGASQARDFANRITSRTRNGWYAYTDRGGRAQCQRVDFRFMGLWDTVLSTNDSGYAYNLAIPPDFAYVAHAVALNEYRNGLVHAFGSFGAFPLESIMQSAAGSPSIPGHTMIERGFVGAHADIGGGFGEEVRQLSDVALAWMVKQASAAGVAMNAGPSTIIASPVIHDRSESILTGAPLPRAEDRIVRYRNGTTTTQRAMALSAGMSYIDTQQFIRYLPEDDPRRLNFVTGNVNMSGYLAWLNANGYDLGMTVARR
jgi:RHS repeat-associated protein